jgi:hypothetical protein
MAEVDSATVIEIGDLVYQDTDDAKPASAQADQGSETANQELFTSKFLGVAMQRSRAGDTSPVRVATTGVFEFDCPGGPFELGDFVGVDQNDRSVAENGDSDALLDQQVDRVGSSAGAIGRVARRAAGAVTSVIVDIRSKVMTGGV